MKVAQIHAFGEADTLVYEEAPVPEPAAGEVRIRVRAVGVNPVDWKIRAGLTEAGMPHQLPLILGWEAAGDIDALGSGVTDFAVGDPVYAMTDFSRSGTYAEYAVVNADSVAPKPKSLDYVQAAAIPMAAETAWLGLYETAQVQAGQTVLVHGAAGSVGAMAVQLAKARGAHVIATASAMGKEFLVGLGVDQFIDYKTQQFESLVKDVDVVFDTQGGKVRELSWSVLRPGGILVSLQQPPATPPANSPAGVRGKSIGVWPSGKSLRSITALIEAGQLSALVQQVFPLREARQALALVEQGVGKPGKVVLEVG